MGGVDSNLKSPLEHFVIRRYLVWSAPVGPQVSQFRGGEQEGWQKRGEKGRTNLAHTLNRAPSFSIYSWYDALHTVSKRNSFYDVTVYYVIVCRLCQDHWCVDMCVMNTHLYLNILSSTDFFLGIYFPK